MRKVILHNIDGLLREKLSQETFIPTNTKHYGEIYAIYLLRKHQRKGLGHQLYQECRRWFQGQGYAGFVTWGLVNNTHARQFYEREGGKIVGKIRITIGGKEYEEYCYLFEILY